MPFAHDPTHRPASLPTFDALPTPERVPLEQIKQVDVEPLKDETEVLPEEEEVRHTDNVVRVVGVATRVEELKQPDLHSGLRLQTGVTDGRGYR